MEKQTSMSEIKSAEEIFLKHYGRSNQPFTDVQRKVNKHILSAMEEYKSQPLPDNGKYYEWVKGCKELPIEGEIHPLRITRDSEETFYSVGNYHAGDSKTFHTYDGAIFLEDGGRNIFSSRLSGR